jgi:hypothetical protein
MKSGRTTSSAHAKSSITATTAPRLRGFTKQSTSAVSADGMLQHRFSCVPMSARP